MRVETELKLDFDDVLIRPKRQGQRAVWTIWVDLRLVGSVCIPSFVVSCHDTRRANDGKVSARVPG